MRCDDCKSTQVVYCGKRKLCSDCFKKRDAIIQRMREIRNLAREIRR